jgi:hypothetical protein
MKVGKPISVLLHCIAFIALTSQAVRADETPYFPTGVFDLPASAYNSIPLNEGDDPNRIIEGDQLVDWYSKHLRAMREPSLLSRPDDGVEIYRLTWLRTFQNPMIFRLQVDRFGGAQMIVKESDGSGGYETGVIVRDTSVNLESAVVTSLKNDLNRVAFWSMPAALGELQLDGSRWVLEGSRGGFFHVVARSSPLDSAFKNWCVSLMKLSGVNPGEVD